MDQSRPRSTESARSTGSARSKVISSQSASVDPQIFSDGKPLNGPHRVQFPDRSVYDGEWSEGKRHGFGTQIYENGAGMYVGEFRYGKREGKGKFTFPGGDVYEGEFVDGKRNGQGRYVYSVGIEYEGEWQDDRIHGRGRAKDEKGRILSATWLHGRLNGEGKLEDGSTSYKMVYANGKLISQQMDTWNPSMIPSLLPTSDSSDSQQDDGWRLDLSNVLPTSGPISGPNEFFGKLFGCCEPNKMERQPKEDFHANSQRKNESWLI